MRTWLPKLLFLGCLAGVGLVGFVWLTKPRLNLKGCSKICPGMTRQKVEEILGGPPGVYASGCLTGEYWLHWGGPATGISLMKESGKDVKEWVGEEWSVLVWFDENDRVIVRHLGDTRKAEPFLDRLRRWVGLK